jgi:integrase
MKDITNHIEKPQVDVMLEVASACNERDCLVILMLWRTGMRVNELLNVRPADLEHHTHMVRVVKAKGSKQRRVPLDAVTLAHLRAYIEAHGIADETPIFPITQQ